LKNRFREAALSVQDKNLGHTPPPVSLMVNAISIILILTDIIAKKAGKSIPSSTHFPHLTQSKIACFKAIFEQNIIQPENILSL
jgi:hypothetical protein